MSKSLSIFLIIATITTCKAQQFAFDLTFTDAVGNSDSVTLGYDPQATDSLDALFNEINIIGTPYNSGLDVRTGNVWFLQNMGSAPLGLTPFETKKQIVSESCGNFWVLFPIAEINVVSDHFPVTARWTKSLFNDSCKNGSVFTSVHPGGWWDTGGFRAELASDDSITFLQSPFFYLSGTDTVNVYWVAFSDSTLLVGVDEVMNANIFNIYPNPASAFVSIQGSKNSNSIEKIEFFNLFGQIILAANQQKDIDISALANGLYFVRVKDGRGWSMTGKLQKM